MIKAIIFDMDGVLINTEPLHFRCWREVFAEDGVQMEYEVYKACIGSTRAVLLNLLKDNYGKVYEDPADVMERMKNRKQRCIEEEGVPVMPGLKEALEKFHQEGYLLAVASSSPAEEILDTLETIGVKEYFSSVTSSAEVKNPKPAPDTFLLAMEKLGLKRSECLVIEDSTNGGKAAAAAGMKCVWFHNPDSGDQSIPTAAAEIAEWNEENAEKIIKIMTEDE